MKCLSLSGILVPSKQNSTSALQSFPIGRKQKNTYSEVKRQTDYGHTELSNMLVKKNVLNEINNSRNIHSRFQGLQENQKESI